MIETGNHALAGTIMAITCCLFQGCATSPGSVNPADLATSSTLPAADASLDHYIAWIPRDQAQTATVAKAVTHISLGNAREQAGEDLCDGAWVLNGSVTTHVGPLPAIAPDDIGGYPAWYYRISRQPGLHGCSNSDAGQVYQAMRDRLPDWINIKPASSAAGNALTLLE